MRLAAALSLSLLAGASGRKKWWENAEPDDTLGCGKCKVAVMRLLVPFPKGCAGSNGTVIKSTAADRAASAYCESLFPPKMKRQCVVYSFGVDNNLDFDKAMLARKDPAGVPIGCRVMSFDPFCCGAAHVLATNHQFAPVGLATYDGLMEAGTEQGNVSFPVFTLRTLMSSNEDPKLDALRLKVSSALEWKGLKNLINLGTIQEIRQLSLNLQFKDEDMWEEYRLILTSLRAAGFVPFYVAKQPQATPPPAAAVGAAHLCHGASSRLALCVPRRATCRCRRARSSCTRATRWLTVTST
ncbi:hypothetical protein EMIHUDRAFT_443591 [Emiliania huxleyi CCMP1516]|uniref:Uncharacterized protein n=3 Tax=Emiliania huxleyi TaxID=2903 RepID=A0A0D3JPU6_EMIH1|nr:hypothetical protein EMIHUDRAFT_443591 [Emiliania huxleyi CCMP1516]EOD25531.1 hypothetical protein EMIHUDRAFT_443591 [Emiliania huxleyi CCMP1516]|eukprot:XP_005777960.1 hypothetical protein EMIHUDRAFT_443591 [Emiliania huxleyi CCMP1516]